MLPLRIQTRLWEETFLGEEEPVLLCRSELPELSMLEPRAQRRINRYYQHLEERFRRRCERRLFPQADGLRRTARAASRVFEPWSVSLTFQAEQPEEQRLRVLLAYRRESDGKVLYSASRVGLWNTATGFLMEESA